MENNYDIIDAKAYRDTKELEVMFKYMASPCQVVQGTIYLPFAQFNAIYLIRHI